VTESLVNIHSTQARHHYEAGLQEDELHELSKCTESTIRSNEEFKNAMRHWRNDLTTDLRQQTARRITSLAVYSEKQFKSAREQYGRQLKEELKDLETSHDDTISNAMEESKQRFRLLRKNYNTTINDNLDRITRLRNEVSELKDQDRHTRKTLREMHNQNTNIIVPLEGNRKSIMRLNTELELCHNQKQQLNVQMKQLKLVEHELKEIEWNHEVLYQKLEALQKDHSSQKKSFNDFIHAAQKQSNYENLVLEQRIQKLSKNRTKNSAAIVGILKRAHVSVDTLVNSKIPITDVVKDKSDLVQFLQDELKNVTSTHSSLLERMGQLKLQMNYPKSCK
jgi:chromosome segregation ATPase